MIKSLLKRLSKFVYCSSLFLLALLIPSLQAYADSVTDDPNYCLVNYCALYDPTATDCSSGSSDVGADTTTLNGSDNEEKVWNFFKSKGLSDEQTAGVMGNLKQESGFDPERVQNGGDSKTPTTDALDGWGLAQWTPPTDGQNPIIGIAKMYNVTTPIYELVTQLNIIWHEMNDHAPNGTMNMIKGLKEINDAGDAASYFDINFESGTDPGGTGPAPTHAGPGGVREKFAAEILQKYNGSGNVSTDSTDSCTQSGTSPDCTTATGNAKILCEAKQWTGVYYRYGGGHGGISYTDFSKQCPDPSKYADYTPANAPSGAPALDGGLSGNPNPCAVDCSGLATFSVDAAFGLNYTAEVVGEDSVMTGDGSQYWKKVDVSQAQPGDIVTHPDHVEVVDHVSANNVYTMGARSTGSKDNVESNSASSWVYAWRWTGPGSDSGGGN